MREIKFRVWDKDTRAYKLVHKENICREMNDLSWLVVEQYTGLKDNHNTEIYEGDIVRIHTNHGIKDLVVEFVVRRACYFLTEKTHLGVSYLLETFIVNNSNGESVLDGEVIGNIHQTAIAQKEVGDE
jgi:uncharacterized phage protein (TIGR01671 family)